MSLRQPGSARLPKGPDSQPVIRRPVRVFPSVCAGAGGTRRRGFTRPPPMPSESPTDSLAYLVRVPEQERRRADEPREIVSEPLNGKPERLFILSLQSSTGMRVHDCYSEREFRILQMPARLMEYREPKALPTTPTKSRVHYPEAF